VHTAETHSFGLAPPQPLLLARSCLGASSKGPVSPVPPLQKPTQSIVTIDFSIFHHDRVKPKNLVGASQTTAGVQK